MGKQLKLMLCTLLAAVARPTLAFDCPKQPEQASSNSTAQVETAVGRLGPLKAVEAKANVQKATTDLLATLPRADQIYLEKMLFAAYCSSIDQDKTTSPANKSKLLLSYSRELRASNIPHAIPIPPPLPPTRLPDIRGMSFRMPEQGMYLQNDNNVYGCQTYLRTNGVLKIDPNSDKSSPSGSLRLTVTRQRYFTGVEGSFSDVMGDDRGHSKEHCNNLPGFPVLQVESSVYITSTHDDGVRFKEIVRSTSPGIDADFRTAGQELGGKAVIESHGMSVGLGDRKFVR